MMPVADGGDAELAKLEMWKQALYDKTRETVGEGDAFSQQDLLAMDVIPNRDLALLARVLQILSNEKLFITMRETSGQPVWKWKDPQEASKYKLCTTEEESMVYSMIDESGGDGIWSQTIQKRLNMHDSVLKNAVKHLQTKGLIKPFKNVEHPNKKMYIKASIEPTERATGGPWYTDQSFDEPFSEEMQKVIFDFIKQRGSQLKDRNGGGGRTQVPKKGVLKGSSSSSSSSSRGKKRDAKEMDGAPPPAKAAKISSAPASGRDIASTGDYIPKEPGFTGYPTVKDIARFLSLSGITNNTVLDEDNVGKLVNVLVWDNLVEPIKIAGKKGYRVSNVVKQPAEAWAGREDMALGGGPKSHVSALTEAPCGKCPVFEICEEGGPVGPSNCIYFKRWLGTDAQDVSAGV